MRTESQTKIKITFLLPALEAGGAERVFINLANGLDRDVFDPYLVTLSDAGALKELIAEHIKYQNLGCSKHTGAFLPLHKSLKHIRPDIVISTMTQMNFIALALQPFLPNTKFIVREAITPSFLLDKYRHISFFIKVLYQKLYRKADLIISPAQMINDELAQIIGAGVSFSVLPNPVNTKALDCKAPLNVPTTNAIRFVCAGRLHKQKGFDRLIVEIAKNKHLFKHPWHLEILGEGEERAHLEQLIATHNLEGRVHLLGFVSNFSQHYKAADCFVLPSRFEGLPNVVLEALACGTPVLATSESGGIKEIEKEITQDNKGALKIFNSTQKLVQAMSRVEIDKHKGMDKNTLLPKCYEYENVIKTLEQLLAGVLKEQKQR